MDLLTHMSEDKSQLNPVLYWYCLVLKSEIISCIGSIEEMNLPPDQMPVLDFRKLNNTRYNF